MKKALQISLALYALAILISMAGMEIFSSTTLLLALILNITEGRKNLSETYFFGLAADKALLAYGVFAVIGATLNALTVPGADFIDMVGYLRWIPLLYFTAYALRLSGLSQKAFVPWLIAALIVCVYGIFGFFTGWDYLRNQPLYEGMNNIPMRVQGLFDQPITFANAFSMSICFPIAALVLGLAKSAKERWLYVVSVGVIGAAIVMSLTRGAWIASFISVSAMLFLVNRKWVIGFAVAVALLIGGMTTFNSQMRARVTSIADTNYVSNSQRIEMWQLAWQIGIHHPFFGVGYHENERRGDEFKEKYGFVGAVQNSAHNAYLDVLASMGFLGLGTYLAFAFVFLMATFRLWKIIPQNQLWHRTLILGALGAQVAQHMASFFDTNFTDSEVRHQFLFILAIVAYLNFVYLRQPSKTSNSRPTPV